jgi:hypothetical protein
VDRLCSERQTPLRVDRELVVEVQQTISTILAKA